MIGGSAFQECESLTQIKLPNSLRQIGDHAFCDCRSLPKINIPPLVERIPKYCFAYCLKITQIKIPTAVESIGYRAFANCNSLSKVMFENHSYYPSIGWGSFCFTNIQDQKTKDIIFEISDKAAFSNLSL